jgi:hypothetical protein
MCCVCRCWHTTTSPQCWTVTTTSHFLQRQGGGSLSFTHFLIQYYAQFAWLPSTCDYTNIATTVYSCKISVEKTVLWSDRLKYFMQYCKPRGKLIKITRLPNERKAGNQLGKITNWQSKMVEHLANETWVQKGPCFYEGLPLFPYRYIFKS